MILVDSSVWIDYFRGLPTPAAETLDGLLSTDRLVIGDLILAEVLQGFSSDRDFLEAKKLLTSMPIITLSGRHIAIQAAQNHRRLRALGVTVRKTIDAIIATRCIADSLTLLHNDRDFDPFVKHLGLRSL